MRTDFRPLNPPSSGDSSGFPDLLDLSNELLLLVAEQLHSQTWRKDLQNLRLTSRPLFALVTPRFWRLFILPRNEVLLCEKLARLSEVSNVARFVRKIDIVLYQDAAMQAVDRLSGVVFGLLAMSTLSRLTSLALDLDFDAGDSPPLVPLTISNALATLKHLRSLTLGVCQFPEGFNLREAVLALRHLSLDCWRRDPAILLPSHGLRLLKGKAIAQITKLELLGGEGATLASLVEPCLESLRALRLEDNGPGNGFDGGRRPDRPLPYAIFRGILNRLELVSPLRFTELGMRADQQTCTTLTNRLR